MTYQDEAIIPTFSWWQNNIGTLYTGTLENNELA